MSTDNLRDKKIILNQKINKLKEQEAKLKEQERKSRNRKIFELGGLLEKAKLDHLPSNQLYGALLEIAAMINDENNEDTLKRWKQKGDAAFTVEEREKGDPVAVTFSDKPSIETRKKIREMGLRWNSFREEWQGICKVELIQQSIKDLGGTLNIVKKSK